MARTRVYKDDSQARRITRRFGGAQRLADLLHRYFGLANSKHAVYAWRYAPHSGLIPLPMVRRILAIARLEGVVLTAEDFDPRPGARLPDRQVLDVPTGVPSHRKLRLRK